MRCWISLYPLVGSGFLSKGMKTTPESIATLEPNQIFVFGSNYAGRHGK